MAKKKKKDLIIEETDAVRGTTIVSYRGKGDIGSMQPQEGVKIMSKVGRIRALGLMDRSSKFFGS